jgi:hypothetical protein
VVAVGSLQGLATTINYRGTNGLNLLLSASPSPGSGTGGTAMGANRFTASGFFQSVAGQDGTSSNVPVSTTTFLSGGGYDGVQANYGYSVPTGNQNGFFVFQPMIVGCGSSGHLTGADNLRSGIGCGGAFGEISGGQGGSGMALIASW